MTGGIGQLKQKAGFQNSYETLPERFFRKCDPSPVKNPVLINFNRKLAEEIGLDCEAFSREELAGLFSGNSRFPDSSFITMAYAGHQFGSFVSQLGDGRAVLVGELVNRLGKRSFIQLKGSGKTPFSRGGDGKAPLGPVIREYLVSEAMSALGVPSTRALAMVGCEDKVVRQQGVVSTGVMTRVAESFVRIGTFEYFKARGDKQGVKTLADYMIKYHFPDLAHKAEPYMEFFEEVCRRQFRLVARWMNIGFIHGVMNTDNSSIIGETIDYGPCAFMDAYNPKTVYSSIDMHGRYSFVNQGAIIGWNLNSLGYCLAHLLGRDEAEGQEKVMDSLKKTQPLFLDEWISGMRKKIGLRDDDENDFEFVRSLLEIMEKQHVDYTLAFRYLADVIGKEGAEDRFFSLFHDHQPVMDLLACWRERLAGEGRDLRLVKEEMNWTNPIYIPRNHRVEKAIKLAEDTGDYGEVLRLNRVLARPFEENEKYREYALPPRPGEEVLQTFCGT